MRLDEGKGGGHSHAILSAFKGEIIILVLKGPVDSMFQNYLHAMLAMILLCTGLVRPGGRGCRLGLSAHLFFRYGTAAEFYEKPQFSEKMNEMDGSILYLMDG